MRTLHLYLMRQVFVTVLMTVAVFTFVLMLGSVLKEILGMLVNRQASFGTLLQAIALLIPFVLVFALPMGMLTGTLLVFGRFSADLELTAARASGISLISLITPVLLLSVALSGLAAIINMQIAPECRVAYLTLLRGTSLTRVGAFIPEKTYIKDITTNGIVYVSKVRGTNLEDVLIYTLDKGKVDTYVRAERGTIQFESASNAISVRLIDAVRVAIPAGGDLPQVSSGGELEFPFTPTTAKASSRVDVSDMTFFQLEDELQDLEKRLGAPAAEGKLATAQMQARMRQLVAQRKSDLTMPVRVQMHRQVAFSFACIGFTLVGIPLGIRAHRRETSFNIAVALILVLIYYSFFILGQALETHPEWSPHLLLWLPNFIFQAVGTVLLWRANRGI